MFPAEVLPLLLAARHGDAIALEQLLQQVRPHLRNQVAFAIPERLQARFDSSDVVQATLTEAFSGWHDFAGWTLEELWGWLGTIQRRNTLDSITKHLRACRTVTREVPLTYEQNPAHGDHPEGWAIAHEEVERRWQALERLPENDRHLILWRRMDAMTHAEIAQLLGIDEAAARKRYARAEARWIQEIRHGSEAT